MDKELITVREFLEQRAKYRNYVVYEWVGAKDNKSATGTKLEIKDLAKRNLNEIGWLDYVEDGDGFDEEYGYLSIPTYSFNLGYNLELHRKIWNRRKAKK